MIGFINSGIWSGKPAAVIYSHHEVQPIALGNVSEALQMPFESTGLGFPINGFGVGPAAIPSASTSQHSLELHNVSYIRSFTTGRWFSKLLNPPITAQFLKDINLHLEDGEIMGIVGSTGKDYSLR